MTNPSDPSALSDSSARRSAPGPAVTVVIPVLDASSVLGECLDALAAQRLEETWEILVVDNGSRDATAEIAAAHAVGATILHEATRGPYAARNAGIGAASGQVVAFTDADCVPDPHWLAAGLATLRDGADLAGGAIVQRKSPRPTMWERYDRAVYLRQEEYVTVQGFAATANLFVRREVFDRIGRFVPELVASGDLEFGRRATRAGFRLSYVPEARIEHRPRTTMRETWSLHRKLGSGFAELARYGERDRVWHDPALRLPLGTVIDQVAADGPPVRRRRIAHVHLLAMAARWVGRLTGRG